MSCLAHFSSSETDVLGFTIQFAVIILNVSDPEFGLTIAVIPITILGLLFTSWAVKNEKLWGMVLTLSYFLCAMGYFLFKLIRMYSGPKAESYGPARRPLATFACVTLILLVISIVNAWVCTSNFGRGLETYVRQRRVGTEPNSPDTSMEQWSDLKDNKKLIPSHRLELD